MQDTEEQINNYIERLNEFIGKDFGENGHIGLPTVHIETGHRFVKIIKNLGSQQSTFGFIDKNTLDIYKAASWKAPAKNFTRGNINDQFGGLGRVRWTGVY